MNTDEFLSSFINNPNPLVSLKELISQISNHTNKQPNKVADELKPIIFGYVQNRGYTNSIAYCDIFDLSKNDTLCFANTQGFPDWLDFLKDPLNRVIASNNLNDEKLEEIAVHRREIINRIKTVDKTILNKVVSIQNTPLIISQNQNDYISLYDLIEWAKIAGNHNDYSDAANDLLRIMGDQTLQLYKAYGGLKPSIDKDKRSLKQALEFIKANNGYEFSFSDDDIPF